MISGRNSVLLEKVILFDPNILAALRLLLDKIESDENVRVLVFDTTNPDYYISHLDVEWISEGATNLVYEWHHFVTRLRVCAHIAGELWVRRGQEGILKDVYI